jgi:hypothetical protein
VRADIVRTVRAVAGTVLFAAACLPACVILVWVLLMGRVAPAAVTELGAMALVFGVAGWVVMPSRRRVTPVLAAELCPCATDPTAACTPPDLEGLWRLPAVTPPHEVRVRRSSPWFDPDGGEIGDRDW